MSTLIKVYSSLLADTYKLTKVRMDLPVDFTLSWILTRGPELDKQLLQYIEGNRALCPDFPEWLMPLWTAFIVKNNDAGILRCLRTLLVFGYKSRYEPSKEQLSDAQKAFEETNSIVGLWNRSFLASKPWPIFREAQRLVSAITYRGDFSDIVPHHGPGAVYPSRKPSMKGQFIVYSGIDRKYPYDKYFNMVPSLGLDDLLSARSEVDSIDCRMIAVPKDSRGPRLICVHPAESIWVQQGQRHVLERLITNNRLTRGRISFDDQTINGNLALSSSLDQKYCTIDLKEASDRMGVELIRFLFKDYLYDLLSCSRASRVRLLDDRMLDLETWAPMGNCLTFPVESLVFWALVRSGILCHHGVSCDDVYVFGDDIIVPTKYYDGAIYGLVSAGLVPNANKCFRKGLFRESCGVDAYNGEDVTPYRMRESDIETYSSAESSCSLAKRLRMGGYSETSAFLYSSVSKQFGRLSLTNNPDCQGLYEWVDYDFGKLLRYENNVRFNARYHTWEVPGRRLVRSKDTSYLHAWWHVQESLLSLLRKERGVFTSHYPDSNPGGESDYSERGLEYPSPRGERLEHGSSIIIMTDN